MRSFLLILVSALLGISSFASAKTFDGNSGYTNWIQQDTEGLLVLTMENGTGGICSILYVVTFTRPNNQTVHYLYADPEDFSAFSGAVTEIETPVIAEFQGFEISIALTASTAGNRLYGRVVGARDRVIVLPAADRRK